MASRILIIEDNAANLELMSYLIKARGYAVITAGDGSEGLDQAGAHEPDLIICDIQMPVLDGFEVARRLKQDPALARIPLVAVTAFAMVGDRDRVMAKGFDGYLPKPINPRTFVDELEGMLTSGLAKNASRKGT